MGGSVDGGREDTSGLSDIRLKSVEVLEKDLWSRKAGQV